MKRLKTRVPSLKVSQDNRFQALVIVSKRLSFDSDDEQESTAAARLAAFTDFKNADIEFLDRSSNSMVEF